MSQCSALWICCFLPHSNITTVALLLHCCIFPNVWHTSSPGYDEAAIEELRLNEGKQLLEDLKDSVEKGRSLDIQDEMGATAFHVAAANGWTNVIDFLLENEADFEITDNDGWQPIHAAAAWGHVSLVSDYPSLPEQFPNTQNHIVASKQQKIS